jgi:hypothetical protein
MLTQKQKDRILRFHKQIKQLSHEISEHQHMICMGNSGNWNEMLGWFEEVKSMEEALVIVKLDFKTFIDKLAVEEDRDTFLLINHGIPF